MSKDLLFAVAFCVSPLARSLAQAGPLEPADFVVAGIPDNYPALDIEPDMARVRQALGPPDNIRRYEFQPGDTTTAWDYNGVIVEFGYISRIGITLTSPRVATRRGLRVGDTEQRLVALYGPPSRQEDSEWIYEDPREHLHVISVTVREGRVIRIYVGSIWD